MTKRGDPSRLDSDETSLGTIGIALLYPVRAAFDKKRPRAHHPRCGIARA